MYFQNIVKVSVFDAQILPRFAQYILYKFPKASNHSITFEKHLSEVYLSTICIVQIIDTIFAFYIAVRCGFDKHLYLTSCLNAHNHNTCICLPQTGCTARKMALFIIIVKIAKHKYLPLMPWQPP